MNHFLWKSSDGKASAPTDIRSEPFLPDFEVPLQFVELTAYPQRSALEPLLTID